MPGVIYVTCTSVGRALIQAHLRYFPEIEIPLIINLSYEKGINKSNFDPLDDLCKQNSIRMHRCDSVNEKLTLKLLSKIKPKIIIQSGWSQKFCDELLSIPTYGCIGEHPSPIPIGRGAACVNWAILEDVKKWGDTFFRMTSQYDRGDVLHQSYFDITDNDTCKTVYEKVAVAGYSAIKLNLKNWYENSFSSIKIDESKASYYKRRTPEDGLIDFSKSAKEIHRLIRAITKPYPGAFFLHQGMKFFVWDADLVLNKKVSARPGTFINLDNNGLQIQCGDNYLLNIKRMSSDFIPETNPLIFFELLNK
jgi:methionyl-tRNA formyltransferase